MKTRRTIAFATVALLLVGLWATAAMAKNEEKDLQDSAGVLQAIMKIPEKGLPPALLREAHAVIIIPGVIKGAFIVGGRHGTGVLLERGENGRWSNPVFVSISGGSVGWQVGATSTDLILVFKNHRGVEGLLKGKFTLGADAAVAAGPVGRSAEAATDVMLKSEILSYSRSRGLFAGIALEGAALLIDNEADTVYYGQAVPAAEILAGKDVTTTPATRHLQELLMMYSARK